MPKWSVNHGLSLILSAGMLASSSLFAATLINANIASEYIVTSMPMTKSPGCPLVGSILFRPGGTLTGTFVTDMARSKAIPFVGSYTLTGGKDITFTSTTQNVPLSNLNGTIARSVIVDKRRPPIESLIITTATEACSGETYKLTLTTDD